MYLRLILILQLQNGATNPLAALAQAAQASQPNQNGMNSAASAAVNQALWQLIAQQMMQQQAKQTQSVCGSLFQLMG